MIIEVFTFLCGVTLAILGSLTFWPTTHGYDFYRPILLFILGYILSIALALAILDIIGRFISSYKKDYKKPSKFASVLLNNGIGYINHHAHIKLKIIGKNKVPKHEKFLLIGNHKSKFDSMLISEKFGKLDLAFITKKENMKVPVAPRLMHRCCYLPVDRDDRLQSFEQFKKGENLIASNASCVGVFPEGSRQKEDVVLGDFHEGAFNIAIHSHCPIVVVTMKGTSKVSKNYPFKVTKVTMTIVDVLRYEDYQGLTAKALSQQVHEMMYENLCQ